MSISSLFAGVLFSFSLYNTLVTAQVCNDPVFNRNYYWSTSVPDHYFNNTDEFIETLKTANESMVGCFSPQDTDDIQELVGLVYNGTVSASVRPIGKSFSWSAVGMMENTKYGTGESQEVLMVNQTQYMSRMLWWDNVTMQAQFEAGASVLDVCSELEEIGLGLADFGGPIAVNFVGSFNSGTHGKGSRSNPIGNLARNVVALEIILPNGTIIDADETMNSDIFYASRVSMGATGIITKFTVQGVPVYNLTRNKNWKMEDVSRTNLTNIKDIIDTTIAGYTPDSIFDKYAFIYGGYQVFRERFQFQNWYFDNETDEYYPNTTLPPCWNYTTENFNEFPCNDVYYKAISPFATEAYVHGANWEAEFYVWEEDFNDAFYAGIKWVLSQEHCNPEIWQRSYDWWFARNPTKSGNKGEIQINTRWVGPDCTWLSPAYYDMCDGGSGTAKPIAQIGIYIPGEFDAQQPEAGRSPDDLWFFWVEGYYRAIRDALPADHPVRVHWGKASLRTHEEIAPDYPRMDEFKDLISEIDSKESFVNQIVRDKLGLCDCGDTCCCTNVTCNKYTNVSSTYEIETGDWIENWFDPETTVYAETSECQPTYYVTNEPTNMPSGMPTDDAVGLKGAKYCSWMAMVWGVLLFSV